jgi:hypothetical protein
VRFSDVVSLAKKYLKAPMAKSQEGMNICTKGTTWLLAERFSSLIKTIFMVFFFSSLVPQAYFLGAINFLIVYWVDKYMLLRRWSIKPPIDASILKTIRMLLAVALMAHCVVTLSYFDGWPFDDVNERWQNETDTTPQYYLDENHPKSMEKGDGCAPFLGCQYRRGIYRIFWGTFHKHAEKIDPSSAPSTILYFWLTALVICVVAAFYSGTGASDWFSALFVGYGGDDWTDVATRPSEPGKPYYREGAEGEEILASATDADLNTYVPFATHNSLLFPQLATHLPPWHLIQFKISVEQAKVKKRIIHYFKLSREKPSL